MSQISIAVTIGVGILTILTVILGLVVRMAIKWTVAMVTLQGLKVTVDSMMTQLVDAVTRDNDFETRLRLLEREGTHH